MSDEYQLKSGQINFISKKHSNCAQCVVIKDGEFYNLTNDIRLQLIHKLQEPDRVAALNKLLGKE